MKDAFANIDATDKTTRTPVRISIQQQRDQASVEFIAGTRRSDQNRSLVERLKSEFEQQAAR